METALRSPEAAVAHQIEGIIAPLKEQRAALVAQEEQLKSELAAVRGGMHNIDRILRAANPEHASTNGTPKPKKSSGGGGKVSQEKLTSVYDALKANFPEGVEFTSKQVVEVGGVSQSQSYSAIRMLRERGLLRRTGQVSIGNKGRTYMHTLIYPQVEGLE